MGQARHLLSLLALAGVVLAVAMSGCGSSGESSPEGTKAGTARTSTAPAGASVATCRIGGVAGIGRARVTGVECPFARGIVASWNNTGSCSAPANSSHTSCSLGNLRCFGTATERGLAVSCSAPGRSVSFLAKRG